MLGTGLQVSMYTRKTSIDKWHLNVTQLCSIFCKIQISIKLFYLYQRLQCTDNYFFQIKFVLFLYLLLSALSKENDVTWYFSVIKKTVGYWTTVFTHRFSGVSILQYGCFESCQFRPRSVFLVSWRLKGTADDFECLRYYCDNVSIS